MYVEKGNAVVVPSSFKCLDLLGCRGWRLMGCFLHRINARCPVLEQTLNQMDRSLRQLLQRDRGHPVGADAALRCYLIY